MASSCASSVLPRPLVISPKCNLAKSSFSSFIKLPQIPDVLRWDVAKLMNETSTKFVDTLIDFTFEFEDQNLLQNNFAPVEEIGEAVSVAVIEGSIPDDFPEGVYIRNGPNPPLGSLKSAKSILGKSYDLWVEGEGMLHSLHFSKGGAGNGNNGGKWKWNTVYNSKYVQTDSLKIEMERNRRAFLPSAEGDSPAVMAAIFFNMLRFGTANKVLSNTIVFEHAGRYYSTAENHMPQEIDILTLETLGNWDLLSTSWNRPFNSHSKKAPGTGELVTSGIDAAKPYHVVGVISADGEKMVHKVDLNYSRCSFCHEIGVTERYNVILDFPLTIDPARLAKGGPLIKYDSKGLARIGVMPRYGNADSVKWFQVQPYVAFHLVNCYEDGDEVVVIGCKARAAIIPGPDFGRDKYEWFSRGFKSIMDGNIDDDNSHEHEHDGSLLARIHEWRLNMQTGEVKEMNLTGAHLAMDFPMINERFVGIKNKFSYLQVVDSVASSIEGIAKYGGLAKICLDDREALQHSYETGNDVIRVEHHRLAENTYCSGAAFVPKLGGVEEDDAWIISFVHNENTNTSQAYIIDAKNFSSEPVAKIAIPTRVPYGFHGAFMTLISKDNS